MIELTKLEIRKASVAIDKIHEGLSCLRLLAEGYHDRAGMDLVGDMEIALLKRVREFEDFLSYSLSWEEILKIAFDPGIRATGAAAFHAGKTYTKTFRPKVQGAASERRRNLVDQILVWIENMERENNTKVSAFCVEQYVKFIPNFKKSSLRVLFEFTGYFIGRLENYAPKREIPIYEICKGQATKAEATMLAAQKGIHGTGHEADAYYLGLLAGFGGGM